MKSMYTYMDYAPQIALQIIENKEKLVKPLTDIYLNGQFNKIIIVASGSSYNIATSVRLCLQNILGVEVKVVWPLMYQHFDNLYDKNALVILMSQSGRSTNTIEAAKKALSLGQKVVALSTNKDSTISNYVEHVFEYGSGSEDYYVAKGYICTSVWLILFGLDVALSQKIISEKDYELNVKQIKKSISLLKGIKERSQVFFEKNKKMFLSSRRIMIIGTGAGYGVALEGSLKLNEMVGVATNAYELEEFIHGPSYEVRKDHLLIFIDENPKTTERMNQIYEASKLLTDRVIRISNYRESNNDFELAIPENKNSDYQSITDIIPFQTFSESICSELDMLNYTLTNYDFEQIVKNKA